MRSVAETAFESDIHATKIAVAEQALGSLDAAKGHVAMRREAGCFLERTSEVEAAEAGFAGQLFDREALTQALLDPIANASPRGVRQASARSDDGCRRRRPQHVDEKRVGKQIDVERPVL